MADQENQETSPPSNQEKKPTSRFETVKIYLKDASFEAPAAPTVFLQPPGKQKTEVEVQIENNVLDDKAGLIEIVVKFTVTAKLEDKTLYLAEVHQGGLFQIQHPDPKARELAVEVTCPHILLPFLREELNSLITKGGFSTFLIAPVNFESVYRNKLQEQEKAKAEMSSLDPQSIN